MKKFLSLIVLFSTILFLSSCSDTDTITEVNSEGVDDISLYKGSGPSANGQGALFFDTGNNIVPKDEGNRQNFSFHARIDKNGVVSGSFQAKSRSELFRVKAHGIITCMEIYELPGLGNVAVCTGSFTSLETDYDLINIENYPYFWFKVLDAGEGKNSNGDLFTDINLASVEVSCEVLAATPTDAWYSQNGNFQVKP